MKLVLVDFFSSATMARYSLAPYGLTAYLREHLAAPDLEIAVVSFRAAVEVEKACSRIRREAPDVVAYSCYVWNVEKALRVAAALETDGAYVHVMGGPEITPERVRTLADPELIDYYVIGEGELPFANLMRKLLEGRTGAEALVPGVGRWEGDTFWFEEEASVVELATVPSVYLTRTLPDRLYRQQQAFLETQRGCHWRCKYCVYHKSLPTERYFPLEHVFAEFDYLIRECDIKALRIFDGIFTSDLERSKDIVRHLLKLKAEPGVQLPWLYWEFTYQSVDDEFLDLVRQLKYRDSILNTRDLEPEDRAQHYSELLEGYTAISGVGVQSMNEPVVQTAGRGKFKPEELTDFLRRVREANIVLKVDLILGLPRETFDTYFAGLDALLPYFEGTDHVFNIHRLQILPGSDLEALAHRHDVVYTPEAPHLVSQTATISAAEFEYASRLSAILFRIVNSPLRARYYDAHRRAGKSTLEFLTALWELLQRTENPRVATFVGRPEVDDDYWNAGIFEDLPSDVLCDVLTRV